mmetsp:Transcript_10640/g.13890  ORF Transcript_10640/g.13890 Transcript_10640/m.13890 type:complete len:408 (+) Transcript_10640:279-1502(+)
MNLQDSPCNDLLYLCFNQDNACFAGGTNTGFFAYNCEPFTETTRKNFSSGGIGIIEMCYRTNILALVGGGKVPRYPRNKVMMWDDVNNRCIGELSFPSDVRAVKLRRDMVVVVLDRDIYIYNFQDLKLLENRRTIVNPKGLCALCPHTNHRVMAFPGKERGLINVELFDIQRQVIIPAHESELMALALNYDGTMVASASERGTLIRVFSTASGNMLHELRRGAERAIIHSICINPSSTYLACSSDKGTIHVFSLMDEDRNDVKDSLQRNSNPLASSSSETDTQRLERTELSSSRSGNVTNKPISSGVSVSTGQGSFLSEGQQQSLSSTFGVFFKSVLPKYFASRWSIAQFRVPETRMICAFGSQKNSLIIIGADGSFYKVLFDPQKSTECEKVKYFKFLSTEEADVH